MSVPKEALPACIAAVVTISHVGDSMPGWNDTLSGWLLDQARQNPSLVSSVLTRLWVTSATIKYGDLPGFYELKKDSGLQHFLASVSADVLKTGINEDLYTVGQLVSVLLLHDHQAALEIGETELARNELSAEVRAIWRTALFVIDPIKYLNLGDRYVEGTDGDSVERNHRYNEGPAVDVGSSSTIESRSRTALSKYSCVLLAGGSGDEIPRNAATLSYRCVTSRAAQGTTDAQLERLENDAESGKLRRPDQTSASTTSKATV